MGEPFFTEVTDRSRSAGSTATIPSRSGSTSPTASSSASGWRTTSGSASASGTRSPGPARTCSASGRSTGRGSTRGRDPMAAARQKLAAAFEFLEKLGVPYYCFHDRDVAPEGGTFAEFRDNLDALVRRRAGLPGADRRAAPVGHGQPVQPSRATQAGAATNPDPEVFAVRRGPGQAHAGGRPSGWAATNYVLWGGREGYDTLLNTDLRREGEQFARFLHLVAEHKHRIGFAGPLLIEPKPMEPTKHQYDYDSATDPWLPRPQRPRGRVPAEHRGQPRDARRPQLPPRGRRTRSPTASSAASTRTAATRRTAGTPTSSRTRSRTCRWRCTRSCGAAGSRPAASTSTRSSAARASTATTCSTPTSAGSTPWPGALLVGRRPDRGRRRFARLRGALRRLGRRSSGTAILDGDARRSTSSRRGSPAARSTRRRFGSPGAAREHRQPRDLGGRCDHAVEPRPHGRRRARRWASSSASTSRRPRPRPSSSTRTGASLGDRRRRVRLRASRARCWSEQDPALWWTGTIAAIRCGPGAQRGIAGDAVAADRPDRPDARAVLLDAADEVLRPAILWNDQRTAAECDAIRAAVGAERLVAITGNDALTGFTAPKLVWVRDHEPDVWAPGRPRAAAQGLRAAPADRRARHGQGRRRRDAAVRPRGARLVARGAGGARDRPCLAAADVRGTGGDRRDHRRRRPRRPGSGPARRSSPAAATRRANARRRRRGRAGDGRPVARARRA